MSDSVRCLLEVYEAMEQIVRVLQVFLYNNSIIEDLSYCALACMVKNLLVLLLAVPQPWPVVS